MTLFTETLAKNLIVINRRFDPHTRVIIRVKETDDSCMRVETSVYYYFLARVSVNNVRISLS